MRLFKDNSIESKEYIEPGISNVIKKIMEFGKVVYYRDYRETFDVFMRTIREFEDFKPRLELYYSSLVA